MHYTASRFTSTYRERWGASQVSWEAVVTSSFFALFFFPFLLLHGVPNNQILVQMRSWCKMQSPPVLSVAIFKSSDINQNSQLWNTSDRYSTTRTFGGHRCSMLKVQGSSVPMVVEQFGARFLKRSQNAKPCKATL